MTEKTTANQRNSLLAEPTVQGELMFRVILYWLMWASIVITAIAREYFAFAPDGNIIGLLGSIGQRYGVAAFAVMALLPLMLIDCLMITQRVVGPVVRIQNSINSLAEGKETTPVRLRDGDYWRDLAASFNRLIHSIHPGQKTKVDPSQDVG